MRERALAWELSGTVLRVDHSWTWPVTVEGVSGRSLLLSEDEDTVRPLPMGLFWQGGHAVLTRDAERRQGLVRRTVERFSQGAPRPGARACLDSHVHDGDPMTAHGLAFEEVAVPGELGAYPAWQVPPAPDAATGGAATAGPETWVVAVHGRGATRREALRVLPALASSGVTTLVIGYRGDPGCPAEPDGFTHLGDTEWHEVARAVRYAREQGAASVVLYGWSMGAMIALLALERMPPADAAPVAGVIADCPVLDWTAVLDAQAAALGIPAAVARRVRGHIERRARLSLAALDRTGPAAALAVPVLLFVDRADRTVPPEPALRLARSRPDLVTLVGSAAGHGRSWNQDPDRYEAAVAAFLRHSRGLPPG